LQPHPLPAQIFLAKLIRIWVNLVRFGRNLGKIKSKFGQKGLIEIWAKREALNEIEGKFGQK